MVGEDRVPRECGVGKLYATRIPRVVCGLRPEEGSRAMAMHEDDHAANETSDGDDDAGCTKVVEKAFV